MLSSRDEKRNFPPDGRFARIISRGNQEMKSQVFYKSRYALLTKGRRLTTLKRSPIESSDLNHFILRISRLTVYCSVFSRSGKQTFQTWIGHLPSLEKELSKAGEFSEEYGMCSMALNMDSSGKLG